MYEKILPNKKALTRIFLKSLLGVFAGGILFSLFFLVLDVVRNVFGNSEGANYFAHGFWLSTKLIFAGVILWTLLFASVPTAIGGILLSAIIYRDFKLGIASKMKSIKIGVLLAGLVGLLTSLLVLATTFRPEDKLAISIYSIPVILIASSIGYWGGLQVHKEIEDKFLSRDDVKEKDQ